jgi:flagellar biosynthesis/type III secretory pathway M-ring protein FliF/YscJ
LAENAQAGGSPAQNSSPLANLQSILGNRTILIGAGVGGVILLLIIFTMLIRPGGDKVVSSKYVKVYSHLSLKEAAEIREVLKKKGVKDFQTSDNGTSILVAKKQADEVRLTLALEGLPAGGVVGWEIFDGGSQLGATDFDKRIKLVRAVSGELSRNISRIHGIEEARVQIVQPEKKLFSVEKVPVTAAVFLQIKEGMVLTPSQVKGIIHLVASSVEELSTSNVTVVDFNGVILSGQDYINWYQNVYLAQTPLTPENDPNQVNPEKKKGFSFFNRKKKETQPAYQSLSPAQKLEMLTKFQRSLEKEMTDKAVAAVTPAILDSEKSFIKVTVDVIDGAGEGSFEVKPQVDKMTITVYVDKELPTLKADQKDTLYKSIAAATTYERGRDRIQLQYATTAELNLLKIQSQPIPKKVDKKDIKIDFKWFFIIGGAVIVLLFLRRMTRPSSSKTDSAEESMLKTPAFSTEEITKPSVSAQEMSQAVMQNPGQVAQVLSRWFAEEGA